MGVDFTGVSELRSEPLPARFRPERKPARSSDITALEREIAAHPECASLILTLSGGYLDEDGGVVIPDSVEPSYGVAAEFERTIGAEKDFFAVDWEGSRIWRTTEASVQTSVGRNYAGYAKFKKFLYQLNDNKPFYMPSDTDSGPERGIVSAERCVECLAGLDRVRHHFVADAWKPGMGGTVSLHTESWFFCEFYTVMWRGSQSGAVLIH